MHNENWSLEVGKNIIIQDDNSKVIGSIIATGDTVFVSV